MFAVSLGDEKSGKYLTGISFLSEEPLYNRLETHFFARVKVATEIKQMLHIDKMKI